MNKRFSVSAALFCAATLLAAVSCKELIEITPLDDIPYVGGPVHFSAATSYLNIPGTRTVYSGVDENENPVTSGSQYERIDWVQDDMFRIYSPKSTHAITGVNYADYSVTSFTGTGSNSNAKIAPVGGNGLVWMDSNSDHSFYSVYPDPGTNSHVSIGKVGSDVKIGGTILPVQTITWNGNEGKPDMDYAYMFASVLNAGPTSDVQLFFKPLVTAFKITVATADKEELVLNKVRLESTSCALSGDFTATISGATSESNYSTNAATFACPTFVGDGAGANNFIEVDLGGYTIYKTAGDLGTQPTSASFTVFALPQDLTDLSIYLYTSASTEPRKIVLKQAGASIVFNACRKIYLNNLAIPGEWIYEMTGAEAIVVPKEDYAAQTIVNRNLRADKYATNLKPKDVAWKAYFVPSNETPVVGSLKDNSWSATPLQDSKGEDWLTLSKYEGTGALEEVAFTVAANTLPPRTIEGGEAAEAMMSTLQHTLLETVDLCTYDILTKSKNGTPETANCYIVNGHGTFLIPLVYGNAVKDGLAYPSAYTRTGAAASGDDLPQLSGFVNADANAITSPYILEDTGLSKSGSYKGIILWQDVIDGFEIIDEDDITIYTSAPTGAALSCAYMSFTIPAETIKPGNFIIALQDTGLNKVLWSWHIWVTSENLSVLTAKNSSNRDVPFLSTYIGSTPPLRYSGQETTEREQNVVFVATENNLVLGTMPVTQEQYVVEPINRNESYAVTYFQWGRKDPFLPSAGQVSLLGTTQEEMDLDQRRRNRVKTVTSKYFNMVREDYSSSTHNPREYVFNSNDSDSGYPSGLSTNESQTNETKWKQMYAWSIQHPEVFITAVSAGYGYRHQNLWDINYRYNTSRIAGLKTVYDPSPRGFAVPKRSAFTGWTDAGDDYSAILQQAVDERTRRIWLPLTFKGTAAIGSGIDFPGDGIRSHNDAHTWYASQQYIIFTADRSDGSITERITTGGSVGPINALMVSFGSTRTFFGTGNRRYGSPIRPVLENADETHLGAITAGQSINDINASGMSWD